MISKYTKNKNGEFVCPSCSDVKKNQNTMFYHMKKHEGKLPYVCNICSKDFIQKSSLELHKLSKHKSDNDCDDFFVCPYPNCSFKSLTKANTRIHTIRKHFNDEIQEIQDELNCLSCKKEFQSSTAFLYHAINCIESEDESKLKLLDSLI